MFLKNGRILLSNGGLFVENQTGIYLEREKEKVFALALALMHR